MYGHYKEKTLQLNVFLPVISDHSGAISLIKSLIFVTLDMHISFQCVDVTIFNAAMDCVSNKKRCVTPSMIALISLMNSKIAVCTCISLIYI